ncbi:TonB-linked outer membrane protein, SusC/RagA family [Flaviramulus basaltis]|uniref:TonB-linked outer membrane protein, SusC/RagA family n=1 Tax=Flaviramulus basaltis TaxID=369401 RepID=A0A1K2ILX3_9FLAO|nr:TonB-dependent receptor [Flaviramulus basaltis]SFZ93441.1 TonB-linked outer membrane protein, SusC/RagA family [Flaviramulus basaltis]
MQKTIFKNKIGGRKYYYMLILFFLVTQVTLAQTQVKGTVTDANGLTLPGVTVLEKGTNNGVITDFDGIYAITVNDNATLIFSFLGFKTQEILVNKSSINIILEEDIQGLDEVIVIGYGSQLKEDISGSVSSVDTEALESIPQVSIDQMMQGRAAGVSITTNSGQPGSSVSVRIRGVNSISGSSEPLYIIDGVPLSGDSDDGGTSPLASLNPNDIQSVDILKDASATAIYGSRGANGVVIITTKRGKDNKGVISYNSFVAIQEPTNKIDVLDLQGYAKLQNAINDIYGLNETIEYIRPELLGKGTNWQEEIFENAIMESHQISFSGGKEGTNYFISAGYVDQDGTVIGSGFNRATIRANINSKLSERVNVGVNITASRTDEKLTLNGRSDGVIGLSLLNNPAIPVYNPDGSFAGPVTPDEIAFGLRNPIAEALSLRNKLRKNSILGNIYAEFKISENLTHRTEFGGSFGNNLQDRFTPSYSYGGVPAGANTLSVTNQHNDFWIIKNFLTYHNKFNEIHDLTVLLGAESQEASYGGTTSTDGDFVGNQVPILGTGNADDNNTQYKGSQALESYFGRVIYSLNNKYSLTASMRADGSSKFAQGKKWGYFPSVSAAWKLSNEDFMSDFNAIQNIKVYGGYGEVGNQNIPNFAYGSRLSTVNTGLGTGFLQYNFANPDLTWESSTQTNLGLNFSLFDSSLNATIELYNKVSKDFLYQYAATDFITGGSAFGAIQAPWVNLGEMVNKGIDVTLSYNTSSKDFSWNSSITVSHYKNKVKSLDNVAQINGTMNINYDGEQNITITKPGQPLGLFYGLEVEGLFRSVDDFEGAAIQYGRPFEDALFATTWLGDIKFKDQNNDGVIDDNDRVVIGSPHPDFTFGFQNSFAYKNFDLSLFLQGSYGNDVFNGIGRLLTAGNRTYTNQLSSVLDYWSVENPDGNAPRLARNDTRNIEVSDRYIEDGSYLRIQNVTLGYTLDSKLTDKIGLSKLKLYGSIQNLYTFTNYSGYDPEIGSYNQNTLLTGIDAGRYPSPRTYTLGVNIEF